MLKWENYLVLSLFLCNFAVEISNGTEDNFKTNSIMVITQKMRNAVEGKQIVFTYKGTLFVRPVLEVCDVIHGTWIGDLGFENNNDSHTDSFMVHGNTNDSHIPLMEGLIVQYDSEDGTRHGYLKCNVLK